jgi:hypothetical protein
MFFTVPDSFLLVIGGSGARGHDCEHQVELVTLDPVNNPVPDQLANLNKFPAFIRSGTGTSFTKLFLNFS